MGTFLSPSTRQQQSSLQVAIDTSDIKNGLTIELDGEPYKVINFSVMKQARGAAKMTIKFKNLMRASTIETPIGQAKNFKLLQLKRKAHNLHIPMMAKITSSLWILKVLKKLWYLRM